MVNDGRMIEKNLQFSSAGGNALMHYLVIRIKFKLGIVKKEHVGEEQHNQKNHQHDLGPFGEGQTSDVLLGGGD